MSFNVSGGGYRGSGKYRYAPMAEINVTPFVDVMLVLLIVFMVTAPLLTVGVKVDLPTTRAATIVDTAEPLEISIDAQGQIYLKETPIELDRLVPRLKAITGSNPDIPIFIRADASVSYGQVMQVLGEISAAGFRKVTLPTQLPDVTRNNR